MPPRLLNEASAPPLGTGVVAEHVVVDEVQLPVGAVLVAYSDGLVERPDRDLEAQLDLLCALVGRAYDPRLTDDTLQNLLNAILSELVPVPAAVRDDVCVLVLRRDRDSSEEHQPTPSLLGVG